jgi:hypothetical protein
MNTSKANLTRPSKSVHLFGGRSNPCGFDIGEADSSLNLWIKYNLHLNGFDVNFGCTRLYTECRSPPFDCAQGGPSDQGFRPTREDGPPAFGIFEKPMILCAVDLPVCPFEERIQGNQGADEDVCRPQQSARHWDAPFDCQAVSQLHVPPVPAFAEGKRVNRWFLRLLSHNALERIAGSQSRLRRDQDPAKRLYNTACPLRVRLTDRSFSLPVPRCISQPPRPPWCHRPRRW